jgi:hypothetical protein
VFTITLDENIRNSGNLTLDLLDTENCDEGEFEGSGRVYTLTCPAVDGNSVSVSLDANVLVDIYGRGNAAASFSLLSERKWFGF